MVTALTEMLNIPSFGEVFVYNKMGVMWENFVGDVMHRKYYVIAFISNYFFLRRHGVANFADIMKIVIIFNKETFQDSKEIKRIRYFALKNIFHLYFPIWQNMLIPDEELLM